MSHGTCRIKSSRDEIKWVKVLPTSMFDSLVFSTHDPSHRFSDREERIDEDGMTIRRTSFGCLKHFEKFHVFNIHDRIFYK